MRALTMWYADCTEVRKIFDKLGDDKKSRNVLKSALNKTAKQAKQMLAEKAGETYTAKNVAFKKAMKVRRATPGRLQAVISAEGEPLELRKYFRTANRGNSFKVQILKSGSLKEISQGGIKAFVNNIARKGQVRSKDSSKGKAGTAVIHFAAAQRKGKKRLEIKSLFGNSIPVMLGNEKRVYGDVEPQIGNTLQLYLDKLVLQVLGE